MKGEGTPRRTDPARRGRAAAPAAHKGAVTGDEVEITLRAMRFHTLIGILEHERTLPQPLEVDVTVWCTAGADVLDYRRLYEAAQAVVSEGAIDYLEDVAQRTATRVLGDPRVHRVRVAVRKPQVALPGPLAHAEVVVERQRGAAD